MEESGDFIWVSGYGCEGAEISIVPPGRKVCLIEDPAINRRASAPLSVLNRRGASPCQTEVAKFVVDRNCVAVRQGGEQRKAKE